MQPSLRNYFVAVVVVATTAVLCDAEGRSGAPTFGDLLGVRSQSDDAESPALDSASSGVESPSVAPQGTLARPQDGEKHPDLEKAWAKYDAALVKAIEEFKAAIAKQFDAAVGRGDLDAAEKWQEVLAKFEKEGVLPAEDETEKAVRVARSAFVRAQVPLQKAYESVTAALTKEKNLTDAKAVREEWQSLTADQLPQPSRKDPPISRSGNIFQSVRQAVAKGEIDERSYVGGAGVGTDFRDGLPEGGVLVGMRMTTGTFGTGGYKAVASIEPIYRTEQGEKRGATHGPLRANATEIVARDGYAVGAIRLKMQPHPRVLGLQLVFMRIAGNRLDTKDSYLSQPYIDMTDDAAVIGGDGRPIVGIKGSVSKEEMRGVGVIQVK